MKSPALSRPISYSQISTYLRCQKAHEYNYRRGLVPLRKSVALRIGSLVDAGLEAAITVEANGDSHINTEAWLAIETMHTKWVSDPSIAAMMEMAPDLLDEAIKVRDDSMSITRRAIKALGLDSGKWTTLRDKHGKLGVQYEVKSSFACHPPGSVGKLDWVARNNETGMAWVIDFKTRKSFDSEDALQYDYQLSSYQHQAQPLFEERFAGSMMYQIKSSVPEARVLKSGKPSKDKGQPCDWETYHDAVLSMGLPAHEYADMEHKLPKFQSEIWLTRSKHELAEIWKQVEVGAGQVVDALHGKTALRVLNSRICGWCDYRDVCMAELKGHDAESIISELYTEKTYDEQPTQQNIQA